MRMGIKSVDADVRDQSLPGKKLKMRGPCTLCDKVCAGFLLLRLTDDMKTIIKYFRLCGWLLATLLAFISTGYTQGWQWQNPLPQGDNLSLVTFVDRDHGWIVSEGPILLSTQDAGSHWEILRTGIVFTDIHFIDPLEGWGIGNPRFDVSRWSIYHTTDGGASWQVQLADTTARYDIFFLDDKYGWVTNNKVETDELLYTRDGGNTWESQAEGQARPNDEIFGVKFLNPMKGWAVGGRWGIQTNDGGKTWERDSSLASIRQLFFVDDLHGWGRSGTRTVVRTTDGGQTWTRFQVTDAPDVSANQFFAFDTSRCFLALNIGLYASTDGWQTWALHSSQALTGFAFLDSTEAWGVERNKILHSTDGGKTWQNLTQDIFPEGSTILETVDFVNADVGWMAGLNVGATRSGIILKTVDGGKTWTEQWRKDGVSLGEIIFLDEQLGWGVGSSGQIIHTRDGGQTWTEQASGMDFILRAVCFVDSLFGWAVGGRFANNGVEGIILHTLDGGRTWLDQTPADAPRLFDVAFVDKMNGWIVGGGGSGFDSGVILRTRNGGQTWSIQRQGFGFDFEVAVFDDTLHGWVGGYDLETDANIIHTKDGGMTWYPQLKMPHLPSDMKFVNGFQGWVISLFGRVYYTMDGGNSWQEQQSFTSQWLNGIDFVDSQTGWIVGWYGAILHTDNGGISHVEANLPNASLPKQFILHGNYPNPFNGQTKIRFEILATRANVRLTIYNLQGQLVLRLIDEDRRAGLHEVNWYGVDKNNMSCASGLYFYRIEVDGAAEVGKAILLK